MIMGTNLKLRVNIDTLKTKNHVVFNFVSILCTPTWCCIYSNVRVLINKMYLYLFDSRLLNMVWRHLR